MGRRKRKNRCPDHVTENVARKRRMVQGSFSGACLDKHDRFVWAKLPGVPVMWPSQIREADDRVVTLYVKSDNAILKVEPEHIIPFPGNFQQMKKESLGVLRKKKLVQTMNTFESDCEWAQDCSSHINTNLDSDDEPKGAGNVSYDILMNKNVVGDETNSEKETQHDESVHINYSQINTKLDSDDEPLFAGSLSYDALMNKNLVSDETNSEKETQHDESVHINYSQINTKLDSDDEPRVVGNLSYDTLMNKNLVSDETNSEKETQHDESVHINYSQINTKLNTDDEPRVAGSLSYDTLMNKNLVSDETNSEKETQHDESVHINYSQINTKLDSDDEPRVVGNLSYDTLMNKNLVSDETNSEKETQHDESVHINYSQINTKLNTDDEPRVAGSLSYDTLMNKNLVSDETNSEKETQHDESVHINYSQINTKLDSDIEPRVVGNLSYDTLMNKNLVSDETNSEKETQHDESVHINYSQINTKLNTDDEPRVAGSLSYDTLMNKNLVSDETNSEKETQHDESVHINYSQINTKLDSDVEPRVVGNLSYDTLMNKNLVSDETNSEKETQHDESVHINYAQINTKLDSDDEPRVVGNLSYDALMNKNLVSDETNSEKETQHDESVHINYSQINTKLDSDDEPKGAGNVSYDTLMNKNVVGDETNSEKETQDDESVHINYSQINTKLESEVYDALMKMENSYKDNPLESEHINYSPIYSVDSPFSPITTTLNSEDEHECAGSPSYDTLMNMNGVSDENESNKDNPPEFVHINSSPNNTKLDSEDDCAGSPSNDTLMNMNVVRDESISCKDTPLEAVHISSPQINTKRNSDECAASCSYDALITSDSDEEDMWEFTDSMNPNSPDSEGEIRKFRLKESNIVRDINFPGIYIRKYVKSNKCSKAQSGRKKVGNQRVYDSFHACLYCGQLRQHINVHMKTHRDLPNVKQKFKDGLTDFSKERKEGDHKHNEHVIKQCKGQLLISRRPVGNTFDLSMFGPCPCCKEWMTIKNMKSHYFRKCQKIADKRLSKRQLITQSQVLAGYISSEPSALMVQEVFPSMLPDEITALAKKDSLIIALGDSWLRRSIDNREKRRHYASEHMRLMARLLLAIRSLDEETNSEKNTFSDYLSTRKFELIIAAALQVCVPYMDDIEDLQSPSNAIKIKYDLRRMVNAHWALLVKDEFNNSKAAEMQTLLQLISLEWGEKLIKLARAVLMRRQFQSVKEMPSPQDIAVLTNHLTSQLKSLQLKTENYHRIVQLAQTRLLMFNRRRSGELDVVGLTSYASRSVELSDIDESVLGELNTVEKYLLKSQDLMTVRGKGCRPVPILITDDVRKPLAFLASWTARREAGINHKNQYLFPKSASETSYTRAYASLKKTCGECNLAAPSRITSVTIRKYTATLTQMLDLDQHQLQWMCRHLGHSTDVHATHYRQMSGFVERVHMSKLFLIQDLNLTHRFKGQSLKDIDVSDLLFPDKEKAPSPDRADIPTHFSLNSGEDVQESDVFETCDDTDSDSDEEEIPEVRKNKPKNKPKVVRQHWDAEETQEIQEFFKSHLEAGITPRLKAVEAAKKQSKKKNGKIWLRSNDKIIKKISNMNHKKK